jgi:hypothetical protein
MPEPELDPDLRFLLSLLWWMASTIVVGLVGFQMMFLGLFGGFQMDGWSLTSVRITLLSLGFILSASALVSLRKGP